MASNTEVRTGILKRFRPGSIGLQFTLIVVVSVAATTAAVAAAAYANSRRFALSEAQRRVDLAVLVEASRLRDALVEKSRAVANWGHLEVMRALTYGDVDKQIVDFLERSLAGSPEDIAAVCTDRSGALVAGAGRPDVVAALSGDEASSFTVLPLGPDRLLRFSAVAALAESPGETLGRVALAVDPRMLLSKRSSKDDAGYKLTLLDRDGTPLTDTPRPDTSQGAGPAAEKSITAVAPVGWPENAAGPLLFLAAAEPARVALAPARALQRSIALAGVIVLAIASMLGAAVAMRISRPIRLFTAAVERIRERERLSGPLNLPAGSGEVGVLAEAFTRMAHTLTLAEERNVAQSRLALLGEVAANIAHEVRTPLSSLRSAGQMLASADRDRATRERLGNLIVSEADRLDRVVSDLVQTARPPSGRRRSCSVSELLTRAAATLDPLLVETRNAIEVQEVPPSLAVEADPDQIHQVLLNVMRNALDAGGSGKVVRVDVVDAGDAAVIRVSDGGPGFAASVLARPFAPFQTTKTGGTGLGLAIARRIVEEHGGQVALANLDPRGACVTLRLPVAVSASQPEAPRSRSRFGEESSR